MDMNTLYKSFAVALLFTLVPACSPEQDNRELRAAVDSAKITLAESVSIAESSIEAGTAVRGTLLTKSNVLAVGAVQNTSLQEVRIDPMNGSVLSTNAAGTGSACAGAVNLSAAIAAAEAAVNGEAVVAAPDDDDPCDREVKVLDGDDVLWEVKIAPDGSVKEEEVADDASETDG